MNLQPKRETVTVQKEFLNTTQGLINKVGGITIDGSAFAGNASPEGYLKAGSAVFVPTGADSLAVPYVAQLTTEGAGFITANDVKVTDGDLIVGAHETAFLKRSVVTVEDPGRVLVTQAFIDATNGRFHLR